MANITAGMVKELRERTGAGMMDCKKALIEVGGDMDKAEDWLGEQGVLNSAKKSSRITAEGIVDSYIHMGGRVGVLIEVNIETDFAARNEKFRNLVKDLAMQVAAMNPKYVSREDVPEDVLNHEMDLIRNEALNSGKPEKVVDHIVKGRIEKFYSESCLLDQAFIKDEDKTVETVVKELISEIGENIKVRRFTRYEMGEGLEKKEEDFAAEVQKAVQG